MNIPVSTTATVLIATDSAADAARIKKLLQSEFKHVVVSTDPDKIPGDFVRHLPSVLVLAFDALEKSERYYSELHRMSEEVHRHPHRTIVLCSKDEIKQVYELCKKDYFDDYILFWPMALDSSRLAIFIYHALRELASLKAEGHSAGEFAAQARHLAELETVLSKQVVQCSQHIDATGLAIELAAQKISTALDEFSRRLTSGAFPELLEVKNADGLRNEISQFKRDEIQKHFIAVAESTQPLKQWTREFRNECTPLMKSASDLNAMADSIRPTVLVVDDNEAQRTIIGKLLQAENYNLIFAGDGFEALNILHKAQPDLILMDIMMPNMKGTEALRRLKAVPRFANTPVIMITGDSEAQVVADCMKGGAVDFVVKPFVHATLITKIDHALHGVIPA